MKPFETRVVFFQVRDPEAKLRRIVETSQSHFEKKEHLLLLVEDDKALQYLDELLWKKSPFLPHLASEEETSQWVVLTKLKKNLNRARFAFNLCPTPLLIEGPFQIVYDFEDMTTQSKRSFSQLRFDAYKKAQFHIEAR